MKHSKAKLELKKLLNQFSDDEIHKNNVDLARITFPFNTIPYDIEPEQWKPLIHDEYVLNKYIVSSWGRVYNIVDDFYLGTHLCDKGYIRMAIELNSNTKNINAFTSVRIHRLVGYVFLPEHLMEETINHIDLNKRNNTLPNLEYMSNSNNVKHGYANNAKPKKIYNYFSKEEIAIIKLKYQNGTLIKNLALEYNRNLKCISDIVNNKTYTKTFWNKMNNIS